jgi:hypothetical protein
MKQARKQFSRTSMVRLILAIIAGLYVSGCASTRNVPFNIQSDPLGAYVMFQIATDKGAVSDWVYLGNTPLVTTREYRSTQLKNSNSVVIRVMKEGYFDQTKSWRGGQLWKDAKSGERIFWNPRLVPSN